MQNPLITDYGLQITSASEEQKQLLEKLNSSFGIIPK
jgi:DNA-binding transcriptional regulator WhiA